MEKNIKETKKRKNKKVGTSNLKITQNNEIDIRGVWNEGCSLKEEEAIDIYLRTGDKELALTTVYPDIKFSKSYAVEFFRRGEVQATMKAIAKQAREDFTSVADVILTKIISNGSNKDKISAIREFNNLLERGANGNNTYISNLWDFSKLSDEEIEDLAKKLSFNKPNNLI